MLMTLSRGGWIPCPSALAGGEPADFWSIFFCKKKENTN